MRRLLSHHGSVKSAIRVILCAFLPPILGTYAAFIPSFIDEARHGQLKWLAFLLIPMFASVYGYLVMGFQSAVYALLIEIWLRRSNPKQGAGALSAFIGFSALLGGIAGGSYLLWNSPPGRLFFPFLCLGVGVGLLMGVIVSLWLVEPPYYDDREWGPQSKLTSG